jgi:hypothetical protein
MTYDKRHTHILKHTIDLPLCQFPWMFIIKIRLDGGLQGCCAIQPSGWKRASQGYHLGWNVFQIKPHETGVCLPQTEYCQDTEHHNVHTNHKQHIVTIQNTIMCTLNTTHCHDPEHHNVHTNHKQHIVTTQNTIMCTLTTNNTSSRSRTP